MPTKTFDLVASTVATGSTSTVVFSGLSSLNYTNYCIIASAGTGSFNSRFTLRMNSIAGTNYGNVGVSVIAGTASAADQNDRALWDICSVSNYIGQQVSNNLVVIDFSNAKTGPVYGSMNAKMISQEGGVTFGMSSGQLYPSGQTTSSLTIGNTQSDNFMANSFFFLFGIV